MNAIRQNHKILPCVTGLLGRFYMRRREKKGEI